TRRLPGRTHGVVGIEVVAGAVAVAVHGGAVALPDTLVDLAIMLAARGDFVDPEQRRPAVFRRGDLARIELIVRIECGLQLLQEGVQLAEEFWRIFRAYAFAVLAPEQAAVLVRQPGHAIADGAYQGGLGG